MQIHLTCPKPCKKPPSQWAPLCCVPAWLPGMCSPKSCVTLNPSWATAATRPSSCDQGSLQKESSQGAMCPCGWWGRLALSRLGSGLAVAKTSTGLLVGCFFPAGLIMYPKGKHQCKDGEMGTSGAKCQIPERVIQTPSLTALAGHQA